MTDKVRKDVEALRSFLVDDCIDFPQAAYASLHKAANLIESLSAQLDAAVRDMGMTAHCVICAHHRNNGGNCIGVSMCGEHRPRWQWRGVEVSE